MTGLTDFLLARIAEDEAAARAADEAFARGVGTPPTWTSKRQWERFDPAISEQIRRHDPARVLADCEAKRRIVERLASVQEGDTDEHAWHEQGLFEAVGYLASVYADHDDYREEWRP